MARPDNEQDGTRDPQAVIDKLIQEMREVIPTQARSETGVDVPIFVVSKAQLDAWADRLSSLPPSPVSPEHKPYCDKVFHSDAPDAATVYSCTCGLDWLMARERPAPPVSPDLRAYDGLMQDRVIDGIRQRLERRRHPAPHTGTCIACGHQQPVSANPNVAMASSMAMAQWVCVKCSGQITVSFMVGGDEPSADDDITTLLGILSALPPVQEIGHMKKEPDDQTRVDGDSPPDRQDLPQSGIQPPRT